MGIKLSGGNGFSQELRGRKQLTMLTEAAQKGGTHSEPNPHLSSPPHPTPTPSAAYWSHLPGNKMTLRHDVVLRMDYRASATSQLRLRANGSKASSKARLHGDV